MQQVVEPAQGPPLCLEARLDAAYAKSFLAAHGWLAEEETWLQKSLLGAVELRSHPAESFTHHVGDPPGGIHGIVSGGIGVLLPSRNLELMLCHVLRPGTWFGQGPILTGKTRSLAFQAIEPSVTAYVPYAALQKLIADRPEAKLRLAALSERNFTFAISIIGDLMIPASERRIAAVLSRIARPATEAQQQPYPIHLSQALVGQMANASRDRVNAALSKFTQKGWITVSFRKIHVIHLKALEDHAAGQQ